MDNEGDLHFAAKARLARTLSTDFTVWTEFPVIWPRDLLFLPPRWPGADALREMLVGDPFAGYDNIIAEGITPIYIFDVAIEQEGFITHAFEITHKSPTKPHKWEFCKAVGIRAYELPALWILSQNQLLIPEESERTLAVSLTPWWEKTK